MGANKNTLMSRANLETLFQRAADQLRVDTETFIARVHRALAVSPQPTRPINDAFGSTLTGTGAKRTKAQLDALTGELYGYVDGHPHQRIEQIAHGMGRRTGELKTPLAWLLTDKRLQKTGRARGTAYAVATPLTAAAPSSKPKKKSKHAYLRGSLIDDGKIVEVRVRRHGAKKR